MNYKETGLRSLSKIIVKYAVYKQTIYQIIVNNLLYKN